MAEGYTVIWSVESSQKMKDIKHYLSEHWGQNKVDSFLQKINRFEELVLRFPKLYPASLQHPNLRKAVITKHQSVIYEIDDETI